MSMQQKCLAFGNPAKIWMTTNLEDALLDAEFVIVAIEVNRYFYWAQDFHIPRRYGSKFTGKTAVPD